MHKPNLLLLHALLLATLALSASQELDCFKAPTDAACRDFVVDSSELASELDRFCKAGDNNAYGWPAACSLWHQCRSEKADPSYCDPLEIFVEACSESPQISDQCIRYTSLCVFDSAVQACLDATPIKSLPTAINLHKAALSMCAQMPTMAGCDTCVPPSVGAIAEAETLQVQCPDPLASVSAMCNGMCNGMWMPECDEWDRFCIDNGNNTAFPVFCNYAYNPLEEEVAYLSSNNSTLKVSSADLQDECIKDPSQPQCAEFRLPEDISHRDIHTVCDAMPSMVGCTLLEECEDRNAAGAYCTSFSLLGNVCLDMPTMKGCETYTALCGVQGTVVQQCSSESPIPNILRTEQAMDAILEMCSTHSMPGCEDCTTRWSNCPDPLRTIRKLCIGMPGMPQCSGFFSMCADASGTFSQLCRRDSSDDVLPPMKMYLHASMYELILFKEWVPTSNGAFIGSCLAVMTAAILVQALKGWRVRMEVGWAASRRVGCCNPACGDPMSSTATTSQQPSCCSTPEPTEEQSSESDISIDMMNDKPAHTLKQSLLERLSNPAVDAYMTRNTIRSLFTLVVVFLDYMLMLIVMTFNIGLIVSAVLGFGIGALLFGHLGEAAAGNAAVAVGKMGPDNEHDLEVQFVDPQTCCNTRH